MALLDGQVQVRDLVMGPGTAFQVGKGFNPWRRQVRASSQPRAWGHGTSSGAEWQGEAVVPIPIRVSGVDGGAWLALQQQLSAAFAPVGDSGVEAELRFAVGGREYVMFGRPRMVEPELKSWALDAGSHVALCAFVALDPNIYDGTESTSGAVGLPTFVGGLQVGAGSALLLDGTSGTFASAPDAAALDITGDLDLRWFGAADGWASGRQSLDSKYVTTGNQRSYRLLLRADATVGLTLSSDGTIGTTVEVGSSVALPTADGEDVGLRATWRASDGRVQFFTSDDAGESWTQLGTDATIAVASIHAGTAPLEVGSANEGGVERFSGTVDRVEVRDGIDGTLVAGPRFDAQTAGTLSFDDAQGNTWTLNGAAAIVGTPRLTVPFTIDAVAVDGEADLTNEGTADTGLTLRIDGPVPEPRVVLQRPDGVVQTLRLLFDLTSTQHVLIDTAARTCLLNGLPQASRRGQVSGSWPLLPGSPDGSGATSTLKFRAADNAAAGTVTVTHRSAWW